MSRSMIPRDPGAMSDVYRENTAAMIGLSHRRKKCKCGRTVTSKQLAQYGYCEKCYREQK